MMCSLPSKRAEPHPVREAPRWTEQIVEMSMSQGGRRASELQVLNGGNCSDTSREVYRVSVYGAIIGGQAWSYEDAKHLTRCFLPSSVESLVFVHTLPFLS